MICYKQEQSTVQASTCPHQLSSFEAARRLNKSGKYKPTHTRLKPRLEPSPERPCGRPHGIPASSSHSREDEFYLQWHTRLCISPANRRIHDTRPVPHDPRVRPRSQGEAEGANECGKKNLYAVIDVSKNCESLDSEDILISSWENLNPLIKHQYQPLTISTRETGVVETHIQALPPPKKVMLPIEPSTICTVRARRHRCKAYRLE